MLISDIEELKNTKIYNKRLNKFYTGTKLQFKCDNCSLVFDAVYVHMNKTEHFCKTCRARRNGAKSKGWSSCNRSHHKYWIDHGYSVEDAINQVKKLQRKNKMYWLDRGFSEEESILKAKECLLKSTKSKIEYWLNRGYSEEEARTSCELYKKQSNGLCIEHWLKKGYSEEEARIKISQHIRPRNRLCIEHWLKKGFSEEEARIKILEIQHNIHKTRNNENISINNKKYWVKLHKDTEKYNIYINKISVSNKKHNRTHSPVFKEYWLKKGFSEEESIIKRDEVRCVKNNGNNSSKIEERFFNEFAQFSNLSIIRNKFLTSNKYNICPDGRYKNFIIEFNGTMPHLDKRFYDKSSKTLWGKTFEQKHNADDLRIANLLYNYNVYIVWEYDYLNNKEKVFKDLFERISNETCKNGKYWSSDSL